jgi:endonuclease G
MNGKQNGTDQDKIPTDLIRQGIVIQEDRKIATGLQEAIKVQSGQKRLKAVLDAESSIRKMLIESDTSDPNGYERIIGDSDLVSVNFLARGLKAAAAVCRIRVPALGGEWYGSGFLVGPRLLMTNNHVLALPEEASQTEAEFNYEHDADGVLNPPIQFNLSPQEIFFTDVEHDVTFVAVAPFSEGGVPLERFGYLPLLAHQGKVVEGEWVTIIQHPGGQPKQIAIRASQIVKLDPKQFPDVSERFIHYTTDTEPGSSGACVLNDQWRVIALHHKAVPNPAKKKQNDPAVKEWIANEGVRISAIYKKLESQRFSNAHASAVLERLSQAIGLKPLQVWESMGTGPDSTESDGKPLSAAHWKNPKLGYDPNFLPVGLTIDKILGQRRKAAARLKGSEKITLDYLHFSVVIDRNRKFPMLTAVNIYGAKLMHPGDRSDIWRHDVRIEDQYQPDADFYVKSKGDDPVSFSRGHLVRRFDPCWGDTLEEVRTAETHTFHYTNAAPQVQHYNDVEWGNLEDYILDRIQTVEKKVTVLTGPIFKKFDPSYGIHRKGGPWQIPVIFWKIAIIEKPNGKIAAAAFIIGQTEYIKALYESKVFSGLKPYTSTELQTRKIQTTIATIEQETGFNFSVLRKFDAHGALESTRQTRFIQQNSEITI